MPVHSSLRLRMPTCDASLDGAGKTYAPAGHASTQLGNEGRKKCREEEAGRKKCRAAGLKACMAKGCLPSEVDTEVEAVQRESVQIL